MSNKVFGALVATILIGGVFAAGVLVMVSNYNECRTQFSFLYCVTTHLIR